MQFSKEDKKKIGNNVMAILRGYNCKNAEEFLVRAGTQNEKGEYTIKGLSKSTLTKIIKGEYDGDLEKQLRIIASFGFTTHIDIVDSDLTKIIEPGMFILDSTDSMLDFVTDPEFSNTILDTYKQLFPIIPIQKLEKESNYYNDFSYPMTKEKANRMFDAEEAFKKLFDEENVPEACVNYLSTIGLFFVLTTRSLSLDSVNKLKATYNDDDELAFASKYKQAQESKMETQRRETTRDELLNNYKDKGLYLEKLAKFDEYKDYVYYYMAVCYAIGFVDLAESKLSKEEAENLGANQLKELKKIGNKYAVNYFKLLEE